LVSLRLAEDNKILKFFLTRMELWALFTWKTGR